MAASDLAAPVVVLEAVTKTFGSHVAVDDVSLSIPRGSIYGFIGPNGAGKTSTIRLIMHIHLPDRGRIEVLGRPAGRSTARLVGYLPEERGLYPKMKVRDVIHYYGRLKGASRADVERRADQWLDRLGLSAWKLKKCQDLSKGMQQKVQFIGTVVHEPELLILDEPFSGLDPVNAETLTRIIEEYRRSGRTVIFSTHVMEHAEKLCDAVFMIFKGRKVLDASIEEIRARYREDCVEIEGEGDASVFESVEGVRAARRVAGRLEIDLHAGADPQRLLEAARARFRIARFELRSPRLHEIFVRIAGDGALDGGAPGGGLAARGE